MTLMTAEALSRGEAEERARMVFELLVSEMRLARLDEARFVSMFADGEDVPFACLRIDPETEAQWLLRRETLEVEQVGEAKIRYMGTVLRLRRANEKLAELAKDPSFVGRPRLLRRSALAEEVR